MLKLAVGKGSDCWLDLGVQSLGKGQQTVLRRVTHTIS